MQALWLTRTKLNDAVRGDLRSLGELDARLGAAVRGG